MRWSASAPPSSATGRRSDGEDVRRHDPDAGQSAREHSVRGLAADDYPMGQSELRTRKSGSWRTAGEPKSSPRRLHHRSPQTRPPAAGLPRTCARARVRGPRLPKFSLRSSSTCGAFFPSISAPTLALHSREFEFVSVEHARYLADHIPDGRLVEIDGSDSAFAFAHADTVLGSVEEILTGVPHVPEPDRVLATVLFTDIVDSTRKAAELGDRRWRALLDRHTRPAARKSRATGGNCARRRVTVSSRRSTRPVARSAARSRSRNP